MIVFFGDCIACGIRQNLKCFSVVTFVAGKCLNYVFFIFAVFFLLGFWSKPLTMDYCWDFEKEYTCIFIQLHAQ